MKENQLKVVLKDSNVHEAQIEIDGKPLVGLISAVKIDLQVNSLPQATLTSVIHEVEIDIDNNISFNGCPVLEPFALLVFHKLKRYFENKHRGANIT